MTEVVVASSYCYTYPHPAVTTDVVLFCIMQQRLQLMLIRRRSEPFRSMWALPGGFLEITEDLKTCAKRELEEETGISGVYLEQLYTFGRPDRDPRDACEARWFALGELPDLAFDHAEIIALAHQRLVAKLDYSNIVFQFMPDTFTLSQLQSVYEILLNKRLDKRNFRKRLLAQNLIQATGKHTRTGKHRPARLYRARNPQRVVLLK